MSTAASEPTVLFESRQGLRKFTLNRPKKLNALDEPMLTLLRPKIEEWSTSDLCGTIVGAGTGRAFCSGGDVASVVQNAANLATLPKAIDYFKREFEMDYILASLKKPYIAVMDGITLGGGVGLAANAPFRIATENTLFGMPETKIGYCPDVGASYFLSRLDGELGTYLALTSDTLRGRAVFELGCATHYIPSRRVPALIDRLSALDRPHSSVIDSAIEELSSERQPEEPPTPFMGSVRAALDFAFRHDSVEAIIEDLQLFVHHKDQFVQDFANGTLRKLETRSPTSLKVALKAIRKGKTMSLLQALNMELKIATAFCNQATPDFITGVKAVIIEKTHKESERPNWDPATLTKVTDDLIDRFFDSTSVYLASAPELEVPESSIRDDIPEPSRFALPTEKEIGEVVSGSHISGGATSLRLEELVTRFNNLRPGKMGVREKVLEVARRRCEVEDNADGNAVWLKWKREPTPP
ncbi:3-hydroxyisobutyryl-CoA hydrolase [Macrolepiota fuliginosa MF-IS2]|uniref:3-hydroxyisobutyryl-CoA hydrolase n=1 Tax=Macrolepiota fuliginosa MF-IS2 TaxID=1400762 RepID=A0A9P5XSJ8_9AGAR|nr:3-hydroxyisobutyryl-CoA hydrolase [Macrolepiota fuliginosa MF-IS2]